MCQIIPQSGVTKFVGKDGGKERQEKQEQEHFHCSAPAPTAPVLAAKTLHALFCNLPETPFVILL